MLIKVALPAVEVSKKIVMPPPKPPMPLLLVKMVDVPAVALLVKTICWGKLKLRVATKFCVVPELFVMPTPLIVSAKKGLAVIVKLLAPGAKVIPSTVVFAEIEMAVVFETANVAVSADPLGTVAGVQFAAVFQSPEPGLRSQVALPAKEVWMQSIRPNTAKIPVMRRRGVFMELRRMVTNGHQCPELFCQLRNNA